MKKFLAMHGNTSRRIKADTIEEALKIAIDAANDCMDYTDDIIVYPILKNGEFDYANSLADYE
jgi:hypothetical protein